MCTILKYLSYIINNLNKLPIEKNYLTLKFYIMIKSFFKLLVIILLFLFAYQITSQIQPVAQSKQMLYELNTTAVLVVGTHIMSNSTISKMNAIGDFLESRGVRVKKFYDEKSNWEEIKIASRNAHFFIYSGHGSNMGKNGTGGLVLKKYITNEQIEKELKLRDNAIVLFQSVCRGAGSSAGDDGDIGIKLAEERVSDYAEPFLHIGASCYYANNWDDGCLDFLKDFFKGESVADCFKNSTGHWTKVELNKKYVYDPKYNVGLASHQGSGIVTHTSIVNGVKTVKEVPASKDYNIAYVGYDYFNIRKIK